MFWAYFCVMDDVLHGRSSWSMGVIHWNTRLHNQEKDEEKNSKISNFSMVYKSTTETLTEFFIKGSKLYYTVFHNIARNFRCTGQIDTVSRKVINSHR